MEDKLLLRIALIGSGLGLLVLFALSHFLVLDTQDIGDVGAGNKARISGVVKDVISSQELTIIEVEHSCVTKAVVFEALDVMKGQRVSILGNVQEYKGEKELLVDELEMVR